MAEECKSSIQSAAAGGVPDASACEVPETAAEAMSENGPGCILKRVLNVIGGKWKIRIICTIGKKGSMRYNELRREVDGITNTMLSKSLKELESDGFIRRTLYDEKPLRVEYDLAERGESIMPILLEMEDWGRENLL